MFDPGIQGHQAIRARLADRLAKGQIKGSLMFTGPDGIGKRRVALEFAQRELCFRRTACGACEGCKLFHQDPLPVELPNLLRIAPEGKAGIIKVGVVRDSDLIEGGVIQWSSLTPPPRCHRWIIIEDAHRLNGAAANLLLKTLEEPPAGTHFILVTHRPESVIQTIRSRCERIPFAPLDPAEAWTVARAAGWEDSEREAWTSLSAGSLRLLQRETFELAKAQLEAWIAIATGKAFQEASKPLIPDRDSERGISEQLRQPLELLLAILADLGRMRAGAAPALRPWERAMQPIAQAGRDLVAVQNAVYDTLRNLARNPAPEPLLRGIALELGS